jgi:hypothetical protein
MPVNKAQVEREHVRDVVRNCSPGISEGVRTNTTTPPKAWCVRTPTLDLTMGHAFGVSDERVRSTRRRDAETWPIFSRKAQRRGRR